MALRQLGARLGPRLLHSSAAAQGVGIPERKTINASIGLYEGAWGGQSNPLPALLPALRRLSALPCPSAGLQRSGSDLQPREYATSQKEAPKDLAGVLDESANTLFLTELWRGLALTLKVFFEPKVTVGQRGWQAGSAGSAAGQRLPQVVPAGGGLPPTLPLNSLLLCCRSTILLRRAP